MTKIFVGMLIGIALCVVVVISFRPEPLTELRIQTNEIVQHVSHPPIVLTEYFTNTIHHTNEKLIFVFGELNAFRTNPVWIAQSNGRIHAGLHTRYASVPYEIRVNDKNHISILFGSGVGADYYREGVIGQFGAGATVITVNGNVETFIKAGYSF